ncbi:MAG: hypothetical protein RJB38_1591 [Pseudomonadota bacterium]
MKRARPKLSTPLVVASAIFSTTALAAKPRAIGPTPPILSDEVWKKIAESQLDQTYTIARGDTLYDISKRLFGDANYWPKIWQINGAAIPNPHLIYPSRKLKFSAGSTTSLPSLTLKDESGSDPATSRSKKGTLAEASNETASDAGSGARTEPQALKSEEWKLLPPQPWEQAQIELPKNVDEQGFDLSTKYVFPKTKGLESPWIIRRQQLQTRGRIMAGRNENAALTTGDWIYIDQTPSPLKAGNTYAIIGEPTTLESGVRESFAYPILGKVKIQGINDGLWVGRIEQARGSIEREKSFLILPPPRAETPKSLAAPSAITATLFTEKGEAPEFASQHQLAFIDRGINDGIAPGMVFRAYQYRDPMNDREITRSDVLVRADVQVLQAAEQFSLGLVLRSAGHTLENGTPLVALTDVTELNRERLFQATDLESVKTEIEPEPAPETEPEPIPTPEPSPVPSPEPEKNELDPLESPDSLNSDDQKNLQQLEKHPPIEELSAPEASGAEGAASNAPPESKSDSATTGSTSESTEAAPASEPPSEIDTGSPSAESSEPAPPTADTPAENLPAPTATASPEGSGQAMTSDSSSATESPSASASPTPTPQPSAGPTASPSPSPSPTPTRKASPKS